MAGAEGRTRGHVSGNAAEEPDQSRGPVQPVAEQQDGSSRGRPRCVRRRHSGYYRDAGAHAGASIAVCEAGTDGASDPERRSLPLSGGADAEGFYALRKSGQSRGGGGVEGENRGSSEREGAKLWIQHDILADAQLKRSPAHYE